MCRNVCSEARVTHAPWVLRVGANARPPCNMQAPVKGCFATAGVKGCFATLDASGFAAVMKEQNQLATATFVGRVLEAAGREAEEACICQLAARALKVGVCKEAFSWLQFDVQACPLATPRRASCKSFSHNATPVSDVIKCLHGKSHQPNQNLMGIPK